MDDKNLQENIATFYSRLSPEMQERFASKKWLGVLEELSLKYQLNDKQKQSLGIETTLVLLGMISLEEYEANLKKDLGLSPNSFTTVWADIYGQIINQDKPKIEEAYNQNVRPEISREREEELDDRFSKLPTETQEAIRNINYHAAIYEIAESNKLSVPQIIDLEAVLTDTILGIIPAERFERAVREELEITPENAEKVIMEIKEKIFEGIRKEIRKISEKTTNNNQELEKAGIKITTSSLPQPVSPQVDAASSAPTNQQQRETLEKIERPDPSNPIVVQKLSGPMQTPAVRTEHDLDTGIKPKLPAAPEAKKTDPYREPIE